VSYLSYNYTVGSVGNSAIQSIHANSQAEVKSMSNLVRAELALVSDNLEVISNAKSVETGNVSSAEELFLAAQNATSNLTFAYGWVNRTGAVIYSTNETVLNQANAQGLNVSEAPFFVGAKQTGNTYFSTSFVSEVTGKQIISAARPVYNTLVVNGQQVKVFNGIVSASILLLSIGRFLVSQLPANISNAGLVDPNGVILYARQESLIGSNIYGSQFQALLPSYLKDPFYNMINQSLKGQTGYVDFRGEGVNSTIAYEPVYAPMGGGSLNSQEFATAYLGVADTLGAAQISQINFDRDLSLFTIVGITGAALVASVIVLERNRRLDELVAEKTSELASSNQKLSVELAKEEVLLKRERRSRKEAELLQDILAHDLRNYNQITKMSAELLTIDQNLKNSESKTLVDGILGAVDRSTELIDRAKKLGKILSDIS
jgi:hypothetical protein